MHAVRKRMGTDKQAVKSQKERKKKSKRSNLAASWLQPQVVLSWLFVQYLLPLPQPRLRVLLQLLLLLLLLLVRGSLPLPLVPAGSPPSRLLLLLLSSVPRRARWQRPSHEQRAAGRVRVPRRNIAVKLCQRRARWSQRE